MPEKQRIAALIYAPLEEEYKAVQSLFPPNRQIDGDSFTGYLTKFDSRDLVAVVSGLDWGNEAARKCVSEALELFESQIVISVGIAGAISKDARLGDVYYSKIISDLTQRQKISRKNGKRAQTLYDPVQHQCPAEIIKELDRSRLSISEKSTYAKWQDACALRNRGKLAGHTKSISGKSPSSFERPSANNGQIASTGLPLSPKCANNNTEHQCDHNALPESNSEPNHLTSLPLSAHNL